MTDGRCHQPEMSCSGAEGAEENPRPPPPSAATAAVDLYTQARKSLTDRSPFEEDPSKSTTLPASITAFLSRHSAGRRKHKKAQPDAANKSVPAPVTFWDKVEEYFRPLTLADIDALVHSQALDSCLSMPALGQRAELLELDNQLDANLAKELAVQKELEKELAKQIGALEGLEKELANAEPAVDETGSANDDDGLSLSWLLGSKYRFLLTSERPNKKRKLLGADAGLDLLLRLPYSTNPDPCCHYCFMGPSSSESDPFLQCDACKVWVHRRCYGVSVVPTGLWLCSWCKHMEVSEKPLEKDSWPCELCPKNGGALKPVGVDAGGPVKFAHLFCSMWRPEVYVEDTGAMEPILNVGGVHDMHMKLTCYLCKTKHGACVRCSYGTCRSPFHPICARESKLQMEIWGKFGCDNIELRAFCLKHSNSRAINSSKHSENFNVNVAGISSAAKPPPVLSSNKLPKLKLSRGIRDTSRPQDEVRSTTRIVRSDDTLEYNPLGFRLSVEGEEGELVKNIETGDVQSASITNSVYLVQFLRKLIDRGRVNIDDVASEIGVSSNSLEAALLQGETTSFSPDLKLKIIRWLHDSELVLRSGSATPPDNEVAKIDDTDAGKVCGLFVLDDTKFADLNAPDTAVNPCRTKSKIRILKDNEVSSPAGKIPAALTEDVKEEIIYDKSPNHNLHSCREVLQPLEKILEGSKPTGSSPSRDLPPGLKENSMGTNCNNLDKEHRQTPFTGAVASFGSGNAQADEVNVTTSQILVKGGTHDCDVDVPVSSGQPDLIVGKPHPGEGYAVFKQNDGEAYCNGDDEKTIGSVTVDSLVNASCDHQPLRSFCSEKNLLMDATKECQLAKARDTGVLELSPEDEVEGELLYLQSRLRNISVAINCSCEDLIFRVIQNLPQELDLLNERRWDLIIVSKFLREVQEAKKQGRKERRHREAQAVAAAAAAAAASSRNSSLRKDPNDEINSTHQENPPKVRAASGRDPLPSVCTPKARSFRTSPLKASYDKHTGVSHVPDFFHENALSCDICRRAETVLNRIFVCSCCKVAVHLGCYRSLENPILSWKCELCEEITSLPRSPSNEMVDGRRRHYVDARCVLCAAAAAGGGGGAFRKSSDGHWVHAFCAEWLLESIYRRGQANPVEGLYTILKDKNLQSCCVCKQNVGLCLKCSYGHCQVTFHPTCARNAGLYMNVKSVDGRLQHKAYCEKHSLVQREVDNQQHGTEELNTIRQIRVVLEKARILCERIVKREKLKKELVLCSHEILASQRDAAAFSVLVRSSFFPPGVSSDSATTSINNKSYSGTNQRSDDITVDSTASARPVRFSMHSNVDKRINDGTSSQQFSKRKFSDRTQFSGKHLPHRPASTALQNRAEGEQWSKEKKHMETFHKELVMTSDQASMQNQRLPKGFAYVPVGRLVKEKASSDDIESHEPREPDG